MLLTEVLMPKNNMRIIETNQFKAAFQTGLGRYPGAPCKKCKRPIGRTTNKSMHTEGLCSKCTSETCEYCGGKKNPNDWACLICQMDDSIQPFRR